MKKKAHQGVRFLSFFFVDKKPQGFIIDRLYSRKQSNLSAGISYLARIRAVNCTFLKLKFASSSNKEAL